MEYRVKSPKFLLHVFQFYYLNIEILKFYENWNVWKFWNLMKILKFWHYFENVALFFVFIFFVILKFWNEILKFLENFGNFEIFWNLKCFEIFEVLTLFWNVAIFFVILEFWNF